MKKMRNFNIISIFRKKERTIFLKNPPFLLKILGIINEERRKQSFLYKKAKMVKLFIFKGK